MKNFTFTFTEEQLNIVVGALTELPFKLSSPIIQEITKQFQEQTTPEATDVVAK